MYVTIASQHIRGSVGLFLVHPAYYTQFEIRRWDRLLDEPLDFKANKWYFQTERGSSPQPRASEEEAQYTPPTPLGRVRWTKMDEIKRMHYALSSTLVLMN